MLETTDIVIVSDHGRDGYAGETRQNVVEGLDVNDLEKGIEWGSYMFLQVVEGSEPAAMAASINLMEGVQGGNSIGFFGRKPAYNISPITSQKCHLKRIHA